MTRTSFTPRIVTAGLVAVGALLSASCGEVARTGRSPAFIIIDSMAAAAGEEDSEYTAFLLSDVQTGGGVFNDSGRATMRLALKNPGTSSVALTPSTLNEITLTRYHVKYIRSDGRNTQGVDVPYEFDGAVTATVREEGTEVSFLLVRHTAKREPPLRNMWDGGGMRLMTAIAEVTFYGRDQAGNEVSAVGNINITFGDFADPQ
jgi:hypothetical protein